MNIAHNYLDARHVIAAAMKGSRKLRISGYTTNEGEVFDYDVELLGSDGYRQLIKESLSQLVAGKVGRAGCDVAVDELIWRQACEEQRTSWENTLDGAVQPRQFAEGMVRHPDGYEIIPGQPVTVLTNLRKLQTLVKKAVVHKEVKSKAKTLAKQHIAKHTPINDYLGRLNLAPGKFTSISLL